MARDYGTRKIFSVVPAEREFGYTVTALIGRADNPRDEALTLTGEWGTPGAWRWTNEHGDKYPNACVAYFATEEEAQSAIDNAPNKNSDGKPSIFVYDWR